MANNEQIINLQDKLIKGYKKEIDLLKAQNALLLKNRESYKKVIELFKEENALLKEKITLLEEKITLLSEIMDRQKQDLEE